VDFDAMTLAGPDIGIVVTAVGALVAGALVEDWA
jgi:hypothetical protein